MRRQVAIADSCQGDNTEIVGIQVGKFFDNVIKIVPVTSVAMTRPIKIR